MNKFGSILLILLPTLLIGQTISVSVTNKYIALIKETRHLNIQEGQNIIEVTDLPSRLDPTSVFINSPGREFHVLEQNFEYDLLNAGKILAKAIGTNIRLVNPDGITLTGKLLHASKNDIVLETSNNELQVLPRGENYQIIVEEFGKTNTDWVTKPTLRWLIATKSHSALDAEISYLTKGLGWHAEYIVNLDENDQFAQIAAWVSIDNTSGKTYKNAQLKLIAGDIHLVQRGRRQPPAANEVYEMAAKRSFEQKEFFEYYLYSLERKTTIKNNQINRLNYFRHQKQKSTKYSGITPEKIPKKYLYLLL